MIRSTATHVARAGRSQTGGYGATVVLVALLVALFSLALL